ncbi:MAG TPA: hypothetical protein VG755_29855 [Nannocystaceae bacterium]|nr:hypothetical protein [Nannocystaceae bacterium]
MRGHRALVVVLLIGCNDAPSTADADAGSEDASTAASGTTQSSSESTASSGGAATTQGDGTSDGSSGGAGESESSSSGGEPVPCDAAANTPGGPDPFGGCWPSELSTGIPPGTMLGDYDGSCTVTENDLVIDAMTVTCDPLIIRAANVQITRSKIEGSVLVEAPMMGWSFTITDSEIDAGPVQGTDDDSGIGKSDFVALRVNVYGGKRGVWCEYACSVTDSWIHDQSPDPSGMAHESAVRMGDGSTIAHNSILCNAPDFPPDAGCSADLTGYGDFAPIQNNTIHRNLFMATTGGACAYGGSSGDDGSKPYGDQAANIVFEENVFQRGRGGNCGFYFPITDFDSTRPGNEWIANVWDDGEPLPPAN